jgi:hypothetical protein
MIPANSQSVDVRVYEKRIAALASREEELTDQLNVAKRVQIELARKMMQDMQLVRDEWAGLLH